MERIFWLCNKACKNALKMKPFSHFIWFCMFNFDRFLLKELQLKLKFILFFIFGIESSF